MRPDEHLQAARLRYDQGRSADTIAEHLLLVDAWILVDGSATWAEPVLRRSAANAARSGDFVLARRLLERSLEIPSVTPLVRVRALIELGRVEAAAGGPTAARRWDAAEDRLADLPVEDRVAALTDLAEAMYGSGLIDAARRHFEEAYRYAGRSSRDAGPADAAHGEACDEVLARIVAGLSTTSLLTGRRHRDVERLLLPLTESPPTHPSLPTRALMASAAGEVALGIDRPAPVVHRLVDGALGATPLLASVMRPAVESVAAALSLTGRPAAAVSLLDRQHARATEEHDVVAHVSLLPLRAHAHLLLGQFERARTDAVAALDLISTHPSASGLAEAPTRAVLAVALLELDDVPAATDVIAVADHRQRWSGTPMHGWFLDAVGRVHAHVDRHADAIRAWTEAGREFTLVGGTGSVCEWRDGLARSQAAIGERAEAVRVAKEQLVLATEFRDGRMLAIARGTCAAVEPDHRAAAELLRTALRDLPADDGIVTRCRLGWELGARLRRAGRRREARDQLATSLALATRLGAHHLTRVIESEIVAAGGRTKKRAQNGHITPTMAERETGLLAARGLSNAEIARRRAVSRKTVEAQLSSLYRKLGVPDRHHLAGSLTD